jgi:FtsZ-interacting cell division protein YlmF
MGFFDKGHEKESPIGNLRAHIGTFMYFVKVGKSKFKHKGKVGEIFADMDNTQYLFQQATSGTMYDMKKKLDYTLWDAATHKYTEDIQKLKDELLKAVDEGEESGVFEEEKKEKESEAKRKEEEEKKEEETGDWRSHIKGQMAEAEEKARRETEEKEREMETPAAETEEEALTEEDCRELWRIIQGLEREYKEMNSIADDWFAVHGKKTGCLAALVAMTLLPLGAMYGLYHLL